MYRNELSSYHFSLTYLMRCSFLIVIFCHVVKFQPVLPLPLYFIMLSCDFKAFLG